MTQKWLVAVVATTFVFYVVNRLIKQFIKNKRNRAIAWVAFYAVFILIGNQIDHRYFSQPNIRNEFLNFVPTGETGAPHDMKWIVEHEAGDGGYYDTQYFPGTLNTTKQADGTYKIDWNINGMDFQYQLSSDGQNLKATNGEAEATFLDYGQSQ